MLALSALVPIGKPLQSAAQSNAGAADTPKKFLVYDNMGYPGKPDTAPLGLVNCTIINLNKAWTDKANHVADETAVKEAVRAAARKPGPLVYDIEYVHDFKLFLNLVEWAHEAVPGCVVGYYGHGLYPEQPSKAQRADAAELAAAVDAFFPSAYTYNDNREKWKNEVNGLVQAAHRLAPGKPVYPYIWPQYHKGTAKQFHLVDGDYWKFQLDTARECGADGVVIWSGGKPEWNDKAGWWEETLTFITGNPVVENSNHSESKNDQGGLEETK